MISRHPVNRVLQAAVIFSLLCLAMISLSSCGSGDDSSSEPSFGGLDQAPEAEDILAELEEFFDFTEYDTECSLGMTFMVDEGCHVVGLGYFYVEDDGFGLFSTEEDDEGYSTTWSGNKRTGGPNDKFVAEVDENGIWTIISMP